MDVIRKIAIGVVMIVPTFVFSGLVWSWFHSWFMVFGMMILMGLTYTSVIAGWPVALVQKS